MRYGNVLVAAMLVSATMLPSEIAAQKRVTAEPIEAGGQRCIAWTFVSDVRGVFDRSRIDYRNTCPTPVSFFLCEFDAYGRGVPVPCDSKRDLYSTVMAPPGWTKSRPSSSQARQTVVIRECPTGTRADIRVEGRYFCKK